MKATGIVRRIDELGRVVIPKEIRRTLRIREGDPLEIFTDREGEVILKKYSPIGEMGEFARQFADSVQRAVGHTVCICDRDVILSIAGGQRKEYMDRAVSHALEVLMNDRQILHTSQPHEMIPIIDHQEDASAFTCQLIVPIITEGEVIGAIIIFDTEPGAVLGDTEMKVAQSTAGFIGKHMET